MDTSTTLSQPPSMATPVAHQQQQQQAPTSAGAQGGASSGAPKELSLEEKQRLAHTINEMQVSALLGVVQILMKHLPELKDQAGNELKIDLDGLDTDVLRELEVYCRDHVSSKPLAHSSSTVGGFDGPTPKKAKTERSAPDSAEKAKKNEKAEKDRLQKMYVLAGCERLLRTAGAPLTPMELVLQGIDNGFFQLSGATLPDKQVQNYIASDIKSGKRVFENAPGGKFGLTEFAMPDEEKAAHIAHRNTFLASVPAFPTPATADERQLLRAKFVHQALWKNPTIGTFEKPVDAKALGLHDYHTVITQPMDLGTIKSRLNDGFYHTLADYKRDVDLVWTNAMTYNPPDNFVHQWAATYQAQFAGLLKEYGLE